VKINIVVINAADSVDIKSAFNGLIDSGNPTTIFGVYFIYELTYRTQHEFISYTYYVSSYRECIEKGLDNNVKNHIN
jgi:hypothetical protein